MFSKILFFVSFVGISTAVFIDTSEDHLKDLVKTNPHGWQMIKVYHPAPRAFGYQYEPYAYPKYEFEYSVSDKKTGDHKHHHEARDGDKVRGEYSLVESDGSLRKVQYHADDHNGFNAIVSKTVNKHGDHAISVTDHTRFFYPVGHNIKINHYFPGKDYHYQEGEMPVDNKTTKPVHEENTAANGNDDKLAVTESEEKNAEPEQEKVEEHKNVVAPAPEGEVVKVVPVQIVPAIVSMIPHNTEEEKVSKDEVTPIVEKAEVLSSNDLHPINEVQTSEKEDQSDSDVASSFYHSKFYYIGY